MSADHDYDASDARLVANDIALTDHAIERYRQRTPHDCDIGPREAWTRGEWVKHPEVAQSDGESEPPERVRLYVHAGESGSQAWGIAFLVMAHEGGARTYGRVGNVVVTCNHIQGFDHGPARAYLHSHGPHGGGR